VHQAHTARAVTLSGPLTEPITADAIVTATPGLAIAILTADCQPVLFHDGKAGVVAAAHAGWRGALDGILEATLDEMEAAGARREDTHAVIGPSISQRAYEVGASSSNASWTTTRQRAVLHQRRGWQIPVRSAGLRAQAAARCGRGRGRMDPALHLSATPPLLFLPPVGAPQGGRLRPPDLGDSPLTTNCGSFAALFPGTPDNLGRNRGGAVKYAPDPETAQSP
jgi:hypothetical protein